MPNAYDTPQQAASSPGAIFALAVATGTLLHPEHTPLPTAAKVGPFVSLGCRCQLARCPTHYLARVLDPALITICALCPSSACWLLSQGCLNPLLDALAIKTAQRALRAAPRRVAPTGAAHSKTQRALLTAPKPPQSPLSWQLQQGKPSLGQLRHRPGPTRHSLRCAARPPPRPQNAFPPRGRPAFADGTRAKCARTRVPARPPAPRPLAGTSQPPSTRHARSPSPPPPPAQNAPTPCHRRLTTNLARATRPPRPQAASCHASPGEDPKHELWPFAPPPTMGFPDLHAAICHAPLAALPANATRHARRRSGMYPRE